MQCPSCKEPIDNDSRYCDECGIQIKICPVCGKHGAKKFCTNDQTELVWVGSMPAGGTAAPVQQNYAAPAQQYSQGQQSAASIQTSASGETIKFSGVVVFDAKDGDIIGRKSGSFTNIFSVMQEVSGTHCKIVKLSNGWHIQDLGSTNGTFVQGNRITPNVPYPLSNGVTVKIAIFDFTVMFEDENGGTKRV